MAAIIVTNAAQDLPAGTKAIVSRQADNSVNSLIIRDKATADIIFSFNKNQLPQNAVAYLPEATRTYEVYTEHERQTSWVVLPVSTTGEPL